jgi:aryl-alcohol dehydrogenase-like predicted oxidoreductase
METKQLGNSDLLIPPARYESWSIGGSGWQFGRRIQNDDDSDAAIYRALELGVNCVDTTAFDLIQSDVGEIEPVTKPAGRIQ